MNNISGAGISVIVPAYRAAGTIGRALASVADQTLRPLEVIVVDDGSDDGTLEAAKSSAGLLGDIRLTVLHQYHGGAGAARNRAIMEAAGHYVAFLDADDEWLPAKLERSLPYFDDPAIVLVAHNNLHAEAGAERLNDAASRFRAAPISFVGLGSRNITSRALGTKCCPPSTRIVSPVTARAPNRYSTAPATSSGWDPRASGVRP